MGGLGPVYRIMALFDQFLRHCREPAIHESHLILDFQAGKDVGLGMFGIKDGSSTVNVGVRIAQFQSKSNIALKSDPDWRFSYKYGSSYPSLMLTESIS